MVGVDGVGFFKGTVSRNNIVEELVCYAFVHKEQTQSQSPQPKEQIVGDHHHQPILVGSST